MLTSMISSIIWPTNIHPNRIGQTVDEILVDYHVVNDGILDFIVFVSLENINFDDNGMAHGWYNGNRFVVWLELIANQLPVIHANAFNSNSFRHLMNMSLIIDGDGLVIIHNGALTGLQNIRIFEFYAKRMILPSGVFDQIVATMRVIKIFAWPNDVNLNEMFDNMKYRLLISLCIEEVTQPQLNFRLLANANFTSIRRLESLYLIACGIEVIDLHAFDTIGNTLQDINLSLNRIKTVNIEMFRMIFETKLHASLLIDRNLDPMMCTCHAFDLDIIVKYPSSAYTSCEPIRLIDMTACTATHDVNISQLCIHFDARSWMDIIDIRMIYMKNNSISIRTNFSSRFRMLLINSNGMRMNNCKKRLIVVIMQHRHCFQSR